MIDQDEIYCRTDLLYIEPLVYQLIPIYIAKPFKAEADTHQSTCSYSVASNVVQFVEFPAELVSEGQKIYKSA